MSRRIRPSSARSAILAGTLAASVVATTVLPAFTPVQGVTQASARTNVGHSQTFSAEGKKGRKSTKTVTKTFENGTVISIPDARVVDTNGPANPYPSPTIVSGIKQGRIRDLNLTLRGFSHTFPADVAVLLVAPDGTNALVMADVGELNLTGAEEVSNLTITLDDEATQPLPVEAQLTSGTFQPIDGGTPGPNGDLSTFPAPAPSLSGAVALSSFDGISPNGEWQLFILDDDGSDTGTLTQGWSLEIIASTKSKRRHGKH